MLGNSPHNDLTISVAITNKNLFLFDIRRLTTGDVMLQILRNQRKMIGCRNEHCSNAVHPSFSAPPAGNANPGVIVVVVVAAAAAVAGAVFPQLSRAKMTGATEHVIGSLETSAKDQTPAGSGSRYRDEMAVEKPRVALHWTVKAASSLGRSHCQLRFGNSQEDSRKGAKLGRDIPKP